MAERADLASGGTARWTRLATLGLVMAGLGPLLMLVASIVWGLDLEGDLGFFVITAAIPLIAAFLLSRFGTWAKALGIVAGVLVTMGLFWTAFGLSAPMAFFDFVPGILVVPGALIAIVSSIAALRAGRRGDTPARPEGGEARGIRIVLTAVIALALLSAVLTFTGKTSVDESLADEVIVMKDFEFDSANYDLAGGSTVLVRNEDPFLHTFTIDDLDIDIALGPNDEALVEIPAQAGDYIVYCVPHTSDPEAPEDDDMAATMTIN